MVIDGLRYCQVWWCAAMTHVYQLWGPRGSLSPLLLVTGREMGIPQASFTLAWEKHRREWQILHIVVPHLKNMETRDRCGFYLCFSSLLKSLVVIDLNTFMKLRPIRWCVLLTWWYSGNVCFALILLLFSFENWNVMEQDVMLDYWQAILK